MSSVAEVIGRIQTEASAAPEPKPAASPTAATTPAPQPETPAAEQPAEQEVPQGQPEVEGEPEQEPQIEESANEDGGIAKFSDAYKLHPELRNIVAREQALSEIFPKFSEARQLREWFPTLEDAETTFHQANEARTFGQSFREDQSLFLESLKESDANAYSSLVRKLPEILAQTDTQAYREQAQFYAGSVMANLFAVAQQSGDEELARAVQLVASRGLAVPLGQAAPARPADSETQRLRNQIKQREQEDAANRFESFRSSVNQSFTDHVLSEIESGIKSVLKDATEEQLQWLVPKVWKSVNDKIKSQPQTLAQVEQSMEAAKKGKSGVAEHNAIVDFLTKRAKSILPTAIRDTVSSWSAAAVRANKTKIEEKQRIAQATRDAGSGPQATTSSASNAAPANGKGRHLKDIWNELQSGTYVSPR